MIYGIIKNGCDAAILHPKTCGRNKTSSRSDTRKHKKSSAIFKTMVKWIQLTKGGYSINNITHTFPAGTWAVFPYSGECPKALQDVNTKIWSEWLTNCKEYTLAGNYNIEFYQSPEKGEIWVPVKVK